jgi:hypothetical protein
LAFERLAAISGYFSDIFFTDLPSSDLAAIDGTVKDAPPLGICARTMWRDWSVRCVFPAFTPVLHRVAIVTSTLVIPGSAFGRGRSLLELGETGFCSAQAVKLRRNPRANLIRSETSSFFMCT